MDDKLKTVFMYSRPMPLKYIHSRLPAKFGALKTRSHRLKSEGSSNQDLFHPKPLHSPSQNYIRENNVVLLDFNNSSDTIQSNCAFSSKLFRQRCENIKNTRLRKKQGSLTEGLPSLSPKAIHKTTTVNFRPIELSFTSNIEHHETSERDNNCHMSHKGTVLTLDVSYLPQQFQKTSKAFKNRLNIDNTISRLQSMRKVKIKDQFSTSRRRKALIEEFELKPWENNEDFQQL